MTQAQVQIPEDPKARVALFETEYPGGYVGDWEGSLEVASRYLPPRKQAVLKALRTLEQHFGPITWGEATFNLRVTLARYGYGTRCGANQTIVGRTQDGVEVQYRYKQGTYAEGGNREFKYNGCRWTSISQIGSFSDALVA